MAALRANDCLPTSAWLDFGTVKKLLGISIGRGVCASLDPYRAISYFRRLLDFFTCGLLFYIRAFSLAPCTALY